MRFKFKLKFSKKWLQIFYLFLLLITLVLTIKSRSIIRLFKIRASEKSITLKIKLQGERANNTELNVQITFYSQDGFTKNESIKFTSVNKSVFEGKISLNNDFNFSRFYALFVKPEKYLGKIFCTNELSGIDCKTPQFLFKQDNNIIDLTNTTFMAGDLPPQDGKVDSYDLTKIINNLGKIGASYTNTDINQDFVTNAVDYTLALWSLKNNLKDDGVNLTFNNTPSSTPTLTPTAIPTTQTSQNITPNPTATITPSPFNSPTLTPTPILPTATSIPTPTNTPAPTNTPTPVVAGGRCKTQVTGRIYINAALIGRQCRILNESSYYCVNQQNDCNQNRCLEITKNLIKENIRNCSTGFGYFDESSPIQCSVEFEPTNNCQNPAPYNSCDDNKPRC